MPNLGDGAQRASHRPVCPETALVPPWGAVCAPDKEGIIAPGQDEQKAVREDWVAGFPIYYGWVILVAGMAVQIMSSPGQTYTTSIFIERFIADLGLSRTLVSTLYTIGALCGGLAMGLVGRWVDRYGVRIMAAITGLLFGLACLYMSFVNGAWMLGLGFVLIRMLGQGSLSLSASNAINRWWVRRRGTIMGISGVGPSRCQAWAPSPAWYTP